MPCNTPADRPPVTAKADMYRRLQAGEFGNTIPRWFTVREWRARDTLAAQKLWGVQHTTIPGFPGTRLNVPTGDVERLLRDHGFGEHYCVSPMISEWGTVLWEGNVARMVDGLFAEGHRFPAPGTWRQHMLHPDQWWRSAADALLRGVLNPNSYDDLQVLLDTYPDHVVEFSALELCRGTVPGRNAVFWEVRRY